MTKLEYDKLNEYLNNVCIYIDKNNPFLLENLQKFISLNDKFYNKFCSLTKKVENKTNNLSYSEIIDVASEFIGRINPEYLNKFKQLEERGLIDFSDDEKSDSRFYHRIITTGIRTDKKYIMVDEEAERIIIKRKFNYSDVITLIHEFFHYLNRNDNKTLISEYYTEFISIYFETLASEYLINEKNISPSEIDLYHRISDSILCAKDAFLFEYPLISFYKFGNIDENTYKFFHKYIKGKEESEITKENEKFFDFECKRLLSLLDEKRKDFKSEEEFSNYLSRSALNIYKYSLGTLLTFYAKEKISVDKIIYFNDNMNNYEFYMQNPVDALKNIGIDVSDSNFFEIATQSLEKYLKNMEEINEKGEACLK